ncbi:OsmC family protein [Kibdelosporangium phytohabitans]|uniref:Peroxiredoxin n=1 Tax=Kibdelosporangium phytohabitans TaxID=860235 RepID=A0A0N9HNB6_9PSEU|nr:OsmC family protein [Kibdelosporangium phytohabitans]ALG05818.1 peroxiredoxin [Kibdelosporangium phytohabitans]MBE1466164.1 organic hydroperoxide reductase OsmC/OhrA [Kibdelosporangium phytohabitans]
MHEYPVTITWTGNKGTGTSGYRDFSRDHTVSADGRPDIEATSDPAFRGDPARWNPEQFLVAALSDCHMLWYLHLCATSGVIVESYVDDAVGRMEMEKNGAGQFSEVVLRPKIVISGGSLDTARELHTKAHEMCFIARSVNFPVKHEPEVTAR